MKLNKIALVLAMSGLSSTFAYAQQATENELDTNEGQTVERIRVTGSSIKRTNYEGDLPITVISRADIDAAGITSAEQLMLNLNVASNSNDNLASNAGIVGGEERANNGASSANLRQQGAGSTLVLLNGRRIATHGLKGRSVDLNSIPFAAIDRVEILLGGASAVYGTDAIGGVVNFILKKNYDGVQLSAFADHTEEGSGNIYQFNALAGTGDLNSDGFNVMASLSVKSVEILRGNDRDFTNTFQPLKGLSPDTRGAPYASFNARGSGNNPDSSQFNLVGSGLQNPVTLENNDVFNLLALPGQAGCDSLPNTGDDATFLWNRSRNEGVSCAWDYPRASVLQQPVENIDFVGRGTMKVGDDSEAFIELLASEVTSNKVFEPNQITPWAIGHGDWETHGGGYYPSSGAAYDGIVQVLSDYYGAGQLNIGAPIPYRWRCIECGPREIETVTTAYKIQLGMEGIIGGWDYTAGISRSSNEAESVLGDGYHYTEMLAEALGTGVLNPFLMAGETQTEAGFAALNAASARGVKLFGGETTMTQIDGTISGDTEFELGFGGDSILVAAGFDLRREEYLFNGDAREVEARPRIYGAPFQDADILEQVSRDIKAVFFESIVPVNEFFELNVAVRYDNYDGFGGTTNPKYGAKFVPMDGLLFRAAYSEGFRVPTFNQLFAGSTGEPYTGQDLANPFLCEDGIVNTDDPNCGPITPAIIFGGKTDLGPEEFEQSSAGVIIDLIDNVSFNIDWWEIESAGTIQTPGFRELIEQPQIFADNFVRDGSGNIVAIDRRFINAGGRITSGIEVGLLAQGNFDNSSWAINFNGNYLIEDKKQERDNAPFGPNLVGTHSRGNIPLRWKHTITGTYAHGDFTHTLMQIYRHSYDDETPPGIRTCQADPECDFTDFAPLYDGQVGSYLIYNYSLRYTGLDGFDITAGIKNLFDRDPPFTAHQNDFSPGAAFDPRVADPRGRSYTLRVAYDF